jgi:hypothetical protein
MLGPIVRKEKNNTTAKLIMARMQNIPTTDLTNFIRSDIIDDCLPYT